MTHAWCSDPSRDAAVRAAEDGRDRPLPTLGEAIAAVTESMSVDARGEEMEQGHFAHAAERSVELSKTGDGQSGLRTERITLEVTHGECFGVRQWSWVTMLRLQSGESVRVVEEPAQAASCGGEGEPVADDSPFVWAVIQKGNDHSWCFAFRRHKDQAQEEFPPSEFVYFPLFRAPPQPRGWLTEEEREHIFLIAVEYETQAKHLEKPGTWGSGLPKPSKLRADAAMLRNLLARSSPPEVVLPLADLGDRLLRDGVIDALAAAGVAVKEGDG